MTADRSPAVPPEGTVPDSLAELAALAEEAAEHRQRRIADSTKRYHERDWAQYEAWCDRYGVPALPVDPQLVSLYITDLARQIKENGEFRFKASSIGRHVASISRKNFETGGGKGLGEHEAISDVMAGIRNGRQEPRDAKRPLLLNDVRALIADMDHDEWPRGVTAARDTLAILIGFSTAMRRSEVSGLTVGRITLQPLDGIYIRLGKSKTDQEGQGAHLAVPFGKNVDTCVPCAWVRWLLLLEAGSRADRMRLVYATSADPTQWKHVCRGRIPELDPSLPLLRTVNKVGEIGARPPSGVSLNEMLKRRLSMAGYDPTNYGFHSLRAGFVTQARRNGASPRAVQKQTRHGSEAMVSLYDRDYLPLEGNAVNDLGL